ncbi:MAG: ABC transporter permease [Dehalococcoidales bacterium]|nr:ABC transporter permease [Dehalococcoidales bacterium]
MSGAGVVFWKETVDNARDRRAVLASFFSALFGPLMVLFMITVLGQTTSERTQGALALPVVGAENAPALVAFLKENDVAIQPSPADPEAEVRSGNLAVVLVIPEGYAEDFSAGRPATVRLIVDESRTSTGVSVRRAQRLLDAYSQQIASLRLLARGVSPSVTSVLAVESVDLATPQSQAAGLLNTTPFFIIFAIFIGGMYLAIDSTAGERERGSLEPLLINPVRRHDVVLGKLAATLLFSTITLIGTLIGLGVVLNVMPLEQYFGVAFSLGPLALGAMFLISVPMLLLAAPLQMLVATFTRSYKEALNVLGFLPLVPGLPGLVLGFVTVQPDLWTMLIPTFGQQLLINQVMRAEAVDPLNVVVTTLATAAVGLALVLVVIRLYEREQILFAK